MACIGSNIVLSVAAGPRTGQPLHRQSPGSMQFAPGDTLLRHLPETATTRPYRYPREIPSGRH